MVSQINFSRSNLSNPPVTDVKVVLLVYLSVLLLLIVARAKQFRKPSISLVHACHSVCLSARFPLDEYLRNFLFATSNKICGHVQILVIIGQK